MSVTGVSYSGYAASISQPLAVLGQGVSAVQIADSPAVNVDVNQPRAVKTFTAEAGDRYRVASLFQGSTTTGLSYNIVARGGGNLELDGTAVDPNAKTSFTNDEFNRLVFVAGAGDSDIAVAVQNGSVSSDAIQVTAQTGTTRSLDALGALYSGDPAALVAFGANFAFGGNARPNVSTVGNFTALSGDLYRVANLLAAKTASGGAVDSYQIALRGGGQLILDGAVVDPNSQTTFSQDEFNRLQFKAGATASDFVVSATAGGTTAQALGFTAATGTSDIDRTLNAEPARYSVDAYGLVGFTAQLTQSSQGPKLGAVGDFDAQAGASYRVAALFKATGATDTYNVAIKGDGQLLLDGTAIDPTTRTSFTADEFQRLQFTAGASESKIVVAAQNGGLSSSAIELTASTASQTSLNALPAQYTSDAYAQVAFTANLLNGFGTNAPNLTTVGNFNGQAGDTFRLASLFKATSGVDSYNVAVRGGGAISLDGATIDPATKTSFTADEFNRLVFTQGASASDLLVAAQSGSLSSKAVQITAGLGRTTTNAAGALYTQDAFTLIGYGAALQGSISTTGAPKLSSVGDFNVVAGQTYRVAALFKGQDGASSIGSYSAAVRGDGVLTLDGATIDPNTKTSFTTDEWNRLVFQAGSASSDLVAAASDGTRSSQAVQITATSGATTSLNAGAAAYGGDAFLTLGFTANLLRGSNAASRPSVAATGAFALNAIAQGQAAAQIGAYRATGTSDLSKPGTIGLANLFGATATGGTLAIGARGGAASIVEILAEAAGGLSRTISTSAAQTGAAYGVIAYAAAARLA